MNLVPLTFPAVKPRRHRRRRQNGSPPPTPAALTLVAATFDEDAADNVTLTFGRAIDIAALAPSAIEVSDGEITGYLLRGTAAGTTLLAPAVLKVMLVQVTETTPGGVTLTASSANGIAAVDDGGTWAGTSGTNLPFP